MASLGRTDHSPVESRRNEIVTVSPDSVAVLCEQLRQKAPEYLDLFTSATEKEFEKAFDALLERAISGLETNKRDFEDLDENGLSGVLALALTMPGLTVAREKHSNGHVDLTIDVAYCGPARKILGEAKIYNGPAYHMDGLSQLLGRYTTGREGRGLLIAYVRQKNIKGLIDRLRKRMDEDRPHSQKGDTVDHLLKWSFSSTHRHSSGEDLEVGHVGCNLYIEEN